MASDKPTTRLRELRGSGYEIAKGQPDIRGWDVRDDSGRKFGKVHELIFDIRARKVRYMVVNIRDTKELELEKRTVLIPIGMAVLDPGDDDVILPSVTPFQLRALPRYDKNVLGAKVERDISTVFGRTGIGAAGAGDDMDNTFYDHEHFNEDNIHSRRRGTGRDHTSTGSANRPYEEDARMSRDAELGKPVTFTDPDDVKRLERQQNETEEEYQRRMRRNRS